jgi:hypothetical protein
MRLAVSSAETESTRKPSRPKCCNPSNGKRVLRKATQSASVNETPPSSHTRRRSRRPPWPNFLRGPSDSTPRHLRANFSFASTNGPSEEARAPPSSATGVLIPPTWAPATPNRFWGPCGRRERHLRETHRLVETSPLEYPAHPQGPPLRSDVRAARRSSSAEDRSRRNTSDMGGDGMPLRHWPQAHRSNPAALPREHLGPRLRRRRSDPAPLNRLRHRPKALSLLASRRTGSLGSRRERCRRISVAPTTRPATRRRSLHNGREVIHNMPTHKVTRDSRNGQFVPPREAIRRPATTTTETVRTPKKGK